MSVHPMFKPGKPKLKPGQFRPGKTREDHLPVDRRPRVAEAKARRAARDA